MNLFHTAKNNHLIAGTMLAVGVISFGWIVWFIGATRYQSEVDHWIAYGRANGYTITYDRREQFGFPRKTVLRFVNVHWKNTDGIEFNAGDLDISADLWQTKNFSAKFKGQIQLDVPVEGEHYSLTIGGENGEAKVSLTNDGTWEHCSVSMKNAKLGRSPDYVFLADAITLSAKRPAAQPTDVKNAGLTLSGEADDISLPAAMPPSFGSKLSRVAVDLRLMGEVPDFRKKQSVAEWNKKMGVVQFDRLDMEWGALLLTSKGVMGFDDDLQPEGAFAGVIGHQEKVLETLMKTGFIAADAESMFSSALKLFAKPAPIGNETGIEVPVAVQLGGFFLGPVRIFAFPPIEWE